jgi:hypothetical protein
MAVKSASGVDGDVTLPSGKHIKVDNYSLVITQAQVPTTGFGDDFVTRVGGLKDGAFSYGGTFEYDAASTDPGLVDMTSAPESFVFTVAPACTYTFSGTINSAGASSDVAGAARAAYSGFTSDAVVEAWDVTG